MVDWRQHVKRCFDSHSRIDMHHKGGDRVKPTFLAAVAFSKRSSRAFSFRFLFLRRVSGTSMSYRGHCQTQDRPQTDSKVCSQRRLGHYNAICSGQHNTIVEKQPTYVVEGAIVCWLVDLALLLSLVVSLRLFIHRPTKVAETVQYDKLFPTNRMKINKIDCKLAGKSRASDASLISVIGTGAHTHQSEKFFLLLSVLDAPRSAIQSLFRFCYCLLTS
jgi:hypothetical protein